MSQRAKLYNDAERVAVALGKEFETKWRSNPENKWPGGTTAHWKQQKKTLDRALMRRAEEKAHKGDIEYEALLDRLLGTRPKEVEVVKLPEAKKLRELDGNEGGLVTITWQAIMQGDKVGHTYIDPTILRTTVPVTVREQLALTFRGGWFDSFGWGVADILRRDEETKRYIDNILSRFLGVRVLSVVPATRGGGFELDLASMGLTDGGFKSKEIYNLFYEPAEGMLVTERDIDHNFRPQACLYTAFITSFKDSLESRSTGQRKSRHTPLTYEGLRMATHKEAPVDGSPLECSLRQFEPVFAEFHVAVVAIDVRYQLVYRHKPKAVSHVKRSWYVLVHNKHLWVLNSDNKRLEQLYAQRERSDIPQLDERKQASEFVSVKPLKMPDSVYCADNAAELAKIMDSSSARKEASINIYSRKPEALFNELMAQNYEAGAIQAKSSVVVSFSCKWNSVHARVVSLDSLDADDCAQPTPDVLFSKLDTYMDYSNQLRAAVCGATTLSYYGEGVRALFADHVRSPRVGLLDTRKASVVSCVDVCRAYTSIMNEVPMWPVLSSFDVLRAYAGEDIFPHAFYVVEVAPEFVDGILFDHARSLVTGYTVSYARSMGIPVDVKAALVPWGTVANSAPSIIKALYADDRVSNQLKKALLNITYGMANRAYNRREWFTCCQDEQEAQAISRFGEHILQLCGRYFIHQVSTRDLLNGHLPIGHTILDRMRVKLHQLVFAIRDFSCNRPLAVRTDCVYVDASTDELQWALGDAQSHTGGAKYRVVKKCATYDDIGCLRVESCSEESVPQNPLRAGFDVSQKVHPPAASIEAISMKDEFSASEADSIIASCNTPMLTEAIYPRSGKSYFWLSWARRHNNRLLVVAPTHELKDMQSADLGPGSSACTVHALLGLRVDGHETESGTAVDLKKFDAVLLEEVYMIGVHHLARIACLMREHKNIRWAATGDLYQNRPVEERVRVTSNDYHSRVALPAMFGTRLLLRVMKSVQEASEALKLAALIDDLRSAPNPVACLRQHGVPFKDFSAVALDDKEITHVAYTHATADAVGAAIHASRSGHADLYALGCTVRCSTYYNSGKTKVPVNSKVRILSRDSSSHVIVSHKGNTIRMLETKLRYCFGQPYVRTCHSLQGVSGGPSVVIYDCNSPHIDANWMITAVSRCTRFSGIVVVCDRPQVDLSGSASSRIEGHKAADVKNGFAIDPSAYVTPAWAKCELARLRERCSACRRALGLSGVSQWSIDRRDNALPHIATNCAIVCRTCQCASSHRNR